MHLSNTNRNGRMFVETPKPRKPNSTTTSNITLESLFSLGSPARIKSSQPSESDFSNSAQLRPALPPLTHHQAQIHPVFFHRPGPQASYEQANGSHHLRPELPSTLIAPARSTPQRAGVATLVEIQPRGVVHSGPAFTGICRATKFPVRSHGERRQKRPAAASKQKSTREPLGCLEPLFSFFTVKDERGPRATIPRAGDQRPPLTHGERARGWDAETGRRRRGKRLLGACRRSRRGEPAAPRL